MTGNPMRTVLRVRVGPASEPAADGVPAETPKGPIFTLAFKAPLTEDISRAADIMSGGKDDSTWSGHAGRFAAAREILLPLLVGVAVDGAEVDGWQDLIGESDLLTGAQAITILQAISFRGAGEVEVLDP